MNQIPYFTIDEVRSFGCTLVLEYRITLANKNLKKSQDYHNAIIKKVIDRKEWEKINHLNALAVLAGAEGELLEMDFYNVKMFILLSMMTRKEAFLFLVANDIFYRG